MKIGAVVVAVAASISFSALSADNYYFRLRPSISILNQKPFSLQIDGDRAGVVGSSFNAQAEASSARETLQFNVSDGTLPPGVSLNPASGSISGHPSLKGTFRAIITAQDAFSSASAILNAQIYDSLEIEALIPQYATVGVPYSATFKGLGGDESYRWTLSGNPPDGLIFGGVTSPISSISGIPKTAGVWNDLKVNVDDGVGHSASTSTFSISVADPLKIAGTASASATIGQPYSAKFTSTGGHLPLTWSQSGILPDGLNFANGVISGTPTKSQVTSGLRVRIGDSAGNSDQTQLFSINVSQPLDLSGSATNIATVEQAYSAMFVASGGTGKYSWTLDGTLPHGLSFADGKIIGIPDRAETASNLVVHVSDNEGREKQTAPFSITVCNQLKISGSIAKMGTVGEEFSSSFSASGGDGKYVFTSVGDALPAGLALSNGAISGSPSSAMTASNLIIRVTDGDGRFADAGPFTTTIYDKIAMSGSLSASGTVGQNLSVTMNAAGGHGALSWSVVGGALPPGLDISKGTVSGTPQSAGTWSFTVRAADGDGRFADAGPFSITIYNKIATAGGLSGSGTVGQDFGASMSASGGRGALSWSVVGGSLPPGLGISNGTVSGTPQNAGTWSFTVRAADGDGRFADAGPFSITIYNQITMAGSLSGSGTVGVGFGISMSASGGRGALSWSVVGGSLPPGLGISNGTVSGTPQNAGTWSFIVRAADGDGRYADAGWYSITIYNQISMSGSLSGSGTVGQGFGVAMSASGGRGGLSWYLVGGSLPPGLGLSNGTVSGTPQSAGTWSFVVRAADADGRYADAGWFSITIVDPSGNWSGLSAITGCDGSGLATIPSPQCSSVGWSAGGTCRPKGSICYSGAGCYAGPKGGGLVITRSSCN